MPAAFQRLAMIDALPGSDSDYVDVDLSGSISGDSVGVMLLFDSVSALL